MPSFTTANDAVRDIGLVVPVKLTASSITPAILILEHRADKASSTLDFSLLKSVMLIA